MQQIMKRYLKNATFMPWQARWLTPAVRARLTQTVKACEQGHSGEIRLVIEKSLPLTLVNSMTPRDRAKFFFAHYEVWNTVARSGALIYLNLAEHRLEIVADTGIAEVVEQATWQQLSDKTTALIAADQPVKALTQLLGSVAEILRTHYGHPEDSAGNELPDEVEVI